MERGREREREGEGEREREGDGGRGRESERGGDASLRIFGTQFDSHSSPGLCIQYVWQQVPWPLFPQGQLPPAPAEPAAVAQVLKAAEDEREAEKAQDAAAQEAAAAAHAAPGTPAASVAASSSSPMQVDEGMGLPTPIVQILNMWEVGSAVACWI